MPDLVTGRPFHLPVIFFPLVVSPPWPWGRDKPTDRLSLVCIERQLCVRMSLWFFKKPAKLTWISLFSSTVKSCLDLLVNWLHVYLNNQDSGAKAFCDVALHGPFYSACQAVFYTFVFRHRQLLSGNLKEGQWPGAGGCELDFAVSGYPSEWRKLWSQKTARACKLLQIISSSDKPIRLLKIP